MNNVNMGVIGAGRIGKVHMENLVYRIPEANVLAVADIDLEKAKNLSQLFRVPEVTDQYEEIIQNPKIDAIAICSSTDTHTRIIKKAAASGKHIFCEKPIDLQLSKINDALSAVEKAGIKFMIGFNRRFDPNFHQIRELVNSGKIGKPHILRISSRDPEPPPAGYVKTSGGIFIDMTIHDFDMARYVIGSEVKEVYAKANVLIDPEIGKEDDYDTIVATLFFKNGAMGAIDNSRKAVYGYDQRVEVFGSKGMAHAENNTPHRTVYANDAGVHSALPLYFFMQRYTESFLREMRAFIDAVINDTEVPVNGTDGLNSMIIALAALMSCRENRPVRVEEISS